MTIIAARRTTAAPGTKRGSAASGCCAAGSFASPVEHDPVAIRVFRYDHDGPLLTPTVSASFANCP